MAAYYNEFDRLAAAWLRELIRRGLIAPGDVDERSITEVRADDLRGYTQCHFFAGIGGWSHALRLAGWPDDRPVWTGSCPCQPFSSAGRQESFSDERHLWPVWFDLIRECRPTVLFGEQVEAAIGHGWLDAVYDDLEGAGYAVGAAVLPAACVGAPHVRSRLWFVADADIWGCAPGVIDKSSSKQDKGRKANSQQDICVGLMADADRQRHEGKQVSIRRQGWEHVPPSAWSGHAGVVGDSDIAGLEGFCDGHQATSGWKAASGSTAEAGQSDVTGKTDCFWGSADWLFFRDGKWRPVEPGSFPLANGIPARVGRLRGYGNAIVPQVAAEFIQAFIDCKGEIR